MPRRTTRSAIAVTGGLRTAFARLSETSFTGYVLDPQNSSRRFVVELIVDGLPIKLGRADSYVHELAREGVGDGCYGFSFTLTPAAVAEGSVAEARVSNMDVVVGTPIGLGDADAGRPATPGSVRWLSGLRFEGWCHAAPDRIPVVTVTVDGEAVAEAEARRWMNVGALENVTPARAFDIHLPERLADGRVRRARFVMDDGQELPSSPVTFVAFADRLERIFEQQAALESERLRGERFDRLMPKSLPFSTYDRWRERFPIMSAPGEMPPFALVLIGPGNEEASLESISHQDYEDWVLAALPEAQGQTTFDPKFLREFLTADGASCGLVLFAMTGIRLVPNALQRIAGAFATFPDAVAVYGDVELDGSPSGAAVPSEKRGSAGQARDDHAGEVWPLALSAFDYERMLEQGYCAHLFALRRNQLEMALDSGATDLYRLFNATLDNDRRATIVHLPGSLGALPPIDTQATSRTLAKATAAHLTARGVSANITLRNGSIFPAVRVTREAIRGRVTIIIPVRNKPDLLRACLDSITPAVQAEQAEIIIVDNDSSDPGMLELLGQLESSRILVLPMPGAFNFAKLNNIAAEKANTELLCLLNNDIKALDASWLRELTRRLVEQDVGAVGPLLLWPNGVVQHGGVVLGASFGAVHAFNDRIDRDPGYGDLLRVAHEVSAVTAACLLTRRSDYITVGGMDEVHFPVNFNDVDFCLKLRAAGKRVVFTPHAKLLHLESASRGSDTAIDRAPRFERELRTLRDRWGEALLRDPYYNPMLSLDPVPFSALAWPPRDMGPRRNEPPQPGDVPPGF